MKELHDLALTFRSQVPIILIESLEEIRLLQLFTRLSLRLDRPMFQWSVTEGLKPLGLDSPPREATAAPAEVLKHIKATSQSGYYLLLDFHPYLQEPVHVRLIKEIAQGHSLIPRTLIFLSYALDIPKEIRHHCARFHLQLPDRAALQKLIIEEGHAWQARNTSRSLRVDRLAVERLAENLLGVTATDARRIIRAAVEYDGAITHSDLPHVMKAKYQLIDQEGVISYEYDTAKFKDIAGLQKLKEWLTHRRQAFTGKRGTLDAPRGIMLLGVQGCGKSLAAKAVAGAFSLPLLRLDFGTLYNKFVGETEKNLRRALQTADLMAPCVLWMDEIEKGIAPDQSEEGLSQRVLGTLLTWMAERKSEVFVVATSNGIERLPPELVRKGRLDEIFFVDLPDEETRSAIFSIHLRRRNLAPSGFDLPALAAASAGFSGAEIEQAIVSGLYVAQTGNQPLDNRCLLEELERTRPLSVLMAEQIHYLRAWAQDRTVPAG